MQRPAKFGRNRSSCAGDIKDFSKSKMAGTAAILDLVQRLKLTGNICIASMRRPAKFGRNRSSRAGDIKDLSKFKMAAVPPFWILFKGKNSSGTYLQPQCDDLQNLVEIGNAVPENQ